MVREEGLPPPVATSEVDVPSGLVVQLPGSSPTVDWERWSDVMPVWVEYSVYLPDLPCCVECIFVVGRGDEGQKD